MLKEKEVALEVGYYSNEPGMLDSPLKNTHTWRGTQDEIFKRLYRQNRSLQYCNGCWYAFIDDAIKEKYKEFHEEYNTIDHYYLGDVYD
jgi:hypothetical protein